MAQICCNWLSRWIRRLPKIFNRFFVELISFDWKAFSIPINYRQFVLRRTCLPYGFILFHRQQTIYRTKDRLCLERALFLQNTTLTPAANFMNKSTLLFEILLNEHTNNRKRAENENEKLRKSSAFNWRKGTLLSAQKVKWKREWKCNWNLKLYAHWMNKVCVRCDAVQFGAEQEAKTETEK